MPPGDDALFHLLNGVAGRWPAVDWVIAGLANDYFIPVVMGLVLLWLWFSPAPVRPLRQWGVLTAVLATGLVNAAIKATNLVFFRPRPFSMEEVNLVFYPPTDSSFPSNLAGVTFALAFAFLLTQRRVGWWLLLPAVLVSLARVTAGVHYPSDVLGGMLYGLGAAYAARFLMRWLHPLPRFILKVAGRLYLA